MSLADWRTVPNWSWCSKTQVSTGWRSRSYSPYFTTVFNWFLVCALDLEPGKCPEARWRVDLLPTCLLGRWRWKLVWGWAICHILTAFDFPLILTTDHLKWFSNDQSAVLTFIPGGLLCFTVQMTGSLFSPAEWVQRYWVSLALWELHKCRPV